MVAYDFTNHVIIDKTGYGVADIRNNELRFACAPCKDMWEDWACGEIAVGVKGLRYVKFVMRGLLQRKPLIIDEEESAFVAVLLRKALRENRNALEGFWFRYVMSECLEQQDGVMALHKWVCAHGGESWWDEWLPYVKPIVADVRWLAPLLPPVDGPSMDLVKEAFLRFKGDGDSLIDAKHLRQILHRLNLDLTDAEFEMLVPRPASGPDRVNLFEFLDSLVGG